MRGAELLFMQQVMTSVEPMVTGALSVDARKRNPTNFLSTKVMPVDAYKIRNSLYLTVSPVLSVFIFGHHAFASEATDAESGASFRQRACA